MRALKASTEAPAAALARRGAEALLSGHVKLAAGLLRESLALAEAQAQVHLDLASALLQDREVDGALEHLKRGLELAGESSLRDLPTRRLAAMVHAHRRDWRQVMAATEQVGSDSTLIAIRAAALLQLQRWPEALHLYDNLLAQSPADARWWLGRATAQQALDRLGPAQESLESATQVARDPRLLVEIQVRAAAIRRETEARSSSSSIAADGAATSRAGWTAQASPQGGGTVPALRSGDR